MKIAEVRATPINLPLEAPYIWVFGELPGFSPTIVEVETADGIVGLGEAPSPDAARIVADDLAARLIGRDPIDIEGAKRCCLPHWRGVQSTDDQARITAFGAVEMALWDIRGEAWGQPLYQLLGGAVRKAVAFTDYFSFRATGVGGAGGESTPEAVVDYCQRLHEEHGTTLFEGKLSAADPAPSLRVVELLRRRLGDGVTIRVDSNQAYSLATARLLARPLEDLGCEAAAVDCWCYSGDSGIGSAAYVHLCAALEWLREPNQSLFRMQPVDVIEEGPFRPHASMVAVPEGPGLGVTLSRERLAWCHRHLVDHGPMNKNHDPAAPGTFRRLPLA